MELTRVCKVSVSVFFGGLGNKMIPSCWLASLLCTLVNSKKKGVQVLGFLTKDRLFCLHTGNWGDPYIIGAEQLTSSLVLPFYRRRTLFTRCRPPLQSLHTSNSVRLRLKSNQILIVVGRYLKSFINDHICCAFESSRHRLKWRKYLYISFTPIRHWRKCTVFINIRDPSITWCK